MLCTGEDAVYPDSWTGELDLIIVEHIPEAQLKKMGEPMMYKAEAVPVSNTFLHISIQAQEVLWETVIFFFFCCQLCWLKNERLMKMS